MKTNEARKTSGTPIHCYVILIALTAVLCTYFFAKALNYNNYTIIDNGIETKLPSDSTDPEEILSEAGISLQAGDSYRISDNVITIVHRETTSAENIVMCAVNENDLAVSTAAASGSSTSANSTHYDTEIILVPYETVTYLDPSLAEGDTVVQTEGVNGQEQVTTCTTIVNGCEVSSEVVSTVTLSEPVAEVILTGSAASCNEADTAVTIAEDADVQESDEQAEAAEPAETVAAGSQAAAVTAAATPETEAPAAEPEAEEAPEAEPETEAPVEEPAEPETEAEYEAEPAPETEPENTASAGSETTLTTSDGTVLTYSDLLYVTATAYTGGGTTATGTSARYGAIAVDPSVIPYGTRMYIMTDDGEWIYGYATAEDCGGAIQGNIIDLYFDSYDTCIQFGRRSCTVYILD